MRSGDAIIAASLLSLILVATSHRPRAGDQFEGMRPPEATLGQIRAGNERFWVAFAARDLWSIGRLWAKTDAVSAIFPMTRLGSRSHRPRLTRTADGWFRASGRRTWSR